MEESKGGRGTGTETKDFRLGINRGATPISQASLKSICDLDVSLYSDLNSVSPLPTRGYHRYKSSGDSGYCVFEGRSSAGAHALTSATSGIPEEVARHLHVSRETLGNVYLHSQVVSLLKEQAHDKQSSNDVHS